MKFYRGEKQVSLNVREFAEFDTRSSISTGQFSFARAAIGSAIHDSLRKSTTLTTPAAEFELPLKATFKHKSWSIEIQGRLDQLIPTETGFCIREIKTVSDKLPKPENFLQEKYPHYFLQLATYIELLKQTDRFREKNISGELLFVDISTGHQQTIPLITPSASLFEKQLNKLLPFLLDRFTATQLLSDLNYTPPFPEFRPEQKQILDTLNDTIHAKKITLLEAPTGFGKTGTILDFALNQLKNGVFSRVIYLTSKSTGQLEVIQQLKSMLKNSPDSLRYLQIRNKEDHAIKSPLHSCSNSGDCLKDLDERWERFSIIPWSLFKSGTFTLDAARKLGAQTGICPYEFTRAAIPHAHFWVGDYNYLFSPKHRSLLENQFDFDPKNTLLIIDEAHNLPTRTADAFSFQETLFEVQHVLDDLLYSQRKISPLINALKQWAQFLENLLPKERIDTPSIHEARICLEKIASELLQTKLDYETLSPGSKDYLWGIPLKHKILSDQSLPCLIWSPEESTLQLDCLDAATEISQVLHAFSHTILMSATINPINHYLETIGISPDRAHALQADCPWRKNAYPVAVDTRLNTRFASRENYFKLTAETIAQVSLAAKTPLIVLFPSYLYAENIATLLKEISPGIRLSIQQKFKGVDQQMAFLEESILYAEVLFLILGSSFSESINVLGGAVSHIIVVGPALPQLNTIQRAKVEQQIKLGTQTKEAFKKIYQIPAIQKINQALGRFVRKPGQTAKILLHCNRFLEDDYQSLLAEEYRNGKHITSSDDLHAWAHHQPSQEKTYPEKIIHNPIPPPLVPSVALAKANPSTITNFNL